MGFRKDEERAFQITSDEEIKWATLEDRRIVVRDRLKEQMAELRAQHPEQETQSAVSEQPTDGSKLQDKISVYQNSAGPRALYPKEPKVRAGNKSIYENPHKKRTQKGWKARLAEQARNYLAANAINTEEATPLDEENG